MSAPRSLALLLLVAAPLLPACRDTTPLDFVPPDAASSDAGVDPIVRAACTECLTAGPCEADYHACTLVPKCEEFAVCLLELGCFSPADLQARIECGGPCFERVGIAIGVDPTLVAALPLNRCTLPGGACGAACAPR